MTITATHAAAATPAVTPPAPAQSAQAVSGKAATQASTSAATNTAQRQAALRQMLAKYAYDQSHGIDAGTLAKLGRQITTAAKALGQHVTLPQAATAAPAQIAVAPKGKINVTA